MSSNACHYAALVAELNEPQRQAVLHEDGPLLVVAGPGSGKTRVITHRAACLVQRGIPPQNILAITFTNKAADEMRRRLAILGVAHGMWVYTFHALGARLLRELGPLAGVHPGFTIYDDTDSARVIRQAMEESGIEQSRLSVETAAAAISGAKARLLTPQHFLERAATAQDELLAAVYATYQRLLEQRNAVDFDDLLMRVALVLEEHADIRARLNVRFRHVLIDEYQDTNHAQYLIARDLSRDHRNICVSGDPDQSIYAWRGADIRNILEFERDFPDARIIRLEQNYRSTGHILAVADRLIVHNRRRKHKKLWTTNPAGAPVLVWHFDDGIQEAERVATRIAELHRRGRNWNEMAIFYRVNALSRGFEEALRARGIPYRIARGIEFYNRKEIRDVLAYLRLLVNPADEVALLRVINTPARGVGATTVSRLRELARDSGRPVLEIVRQAEQFPQLRKAVPRLQPFVRLLDELQPLVQRGVARAVSEVLLRSGLEELFRQEKERGGEDRLANVQELVSAARRYEQDAFEPTLAEFLSRVSLVSDQDAVDEQAGQVLLMTLHAAKGLEFPVVFIAGLEQGLLPHERALAGEGDLEEERRLCFVGMTRAREELYLTTCRQRLVRGSKTPRSLSQFLLEICGDSLEWQDWRADRRPSVTFGPTEDIVPVADDLPPEEGRRLRRNRAWPRQLPGPDDAVPSEPPHLPAGSPFADWGPGTLVRHDRYGVGQVLWIQASGQMTRAGLRFPGYGEKTFVLEQTPVRKLERR